MQKKNYHSLICKLNIFYIQANNFRTEDGDFATASLASVMKTQEMNDLVVHSSSEKAIGRKIVCFAVNVSHAQNIAELFKTKGVSAESIHGDMTAQERSSLLSRFESGNIKPYLS